MLAGVADDLCRGVKPHRLRVQQSAGESFRVMALEPGRRVDEKREARRVTFRKPVPGEALELAEAAFGELPTVSVVETALDESFPERLHRAGTAEAAERPAQPIRLRGGEAGGHDRDLHGLLLEQGDAQGLAQDRFKVG